MDVVEGSCGYASLNIVRMEHSPYVEPVTDDPSSVMLDLLVSESDQQRHGVKLMLLFSDPGGP